MEGGAAGNSFAGILMKEVRATIGTIDSLSRSTLRGRVREGAINQRDKSSAHLSISPPPQPSPGRTGGGRRELTPIVSCASFEIEGPIGLLEADTTKMIANVGMIALPAERAAQIDASLV